MPEMGQAILTAHGGKLSTSVSLLAPAAMAIGVADAIVAETAEPRELLAA